MTTDKVHHGKRYDIPADTWAALLELNKELKEAFTNEQKKQKPEPRRIPKHR